MSRQPKLCPKSFIAGYPDAPYGISELSSVSQHGSSTVLGEGKPDQRVFRVKRKHVLKACDRCRVKKAKCDGKQPCHRCSSYNHPCLFRERKATQAKVYSRGFVEMLESHHSLVVKALQKLYKLCMSKEGFPGEPLVEASDGYPLTHAILDRLGLIKQAEDNSEAADEDTDSLLYLRALSNSTDCSATTDPSPEPATPPEPSSGIQNPAQLSPTSSEPIKWEFQSGQPEQYTGYPHGEPKCALLLPSSGTSVTNTCLYYSESSCNSEATDSRLLPAVTIGSGDPPAATAAGLPVDLVGEYHLQMPNQQPVYHPPLTAAWAYPC
ncbi:Zn(II)2Cys6 transcription factor domain-containing protein [Aspergillus lucknowensis]|uniref:Zn(2)-C6 fungal-type domain-containing protein n=1 Tax=Aspergillus lucknowensis TaxID=176173 RepID=A0ABR4M5T0_9EURO